MVKINVNPNFHSVWGQNLLDDGRSKEDSRQWKEYRQKWYSYPQKFYVGKFPLFLNVEATNACNLNCPFCEIPRDNLGFMDFEAANKIIDEAAKFNIYGINFSFRGESLLHPDLAKFMRYAKEKGIMDVCFLTNGILLTEELSRELIEIGIGRLTVSCEGWNKETYNKNRMGGNFDVVVDNIRNLQTLKKHREVDYPKIRIQAVMTPEVEKTFDKYVEFWKGKVEEIAYNDYQDRSNIKKLKFPWACSFPWQRLTVLWDGDVIPCCQGYWGEPAVGNVKKTTLEEIWHSEGLNMIRRKLKEGKGEDIKGCDYCPYRYNEIKKCQKEKN